MCVVHWDYYYHSCCCCCARVNFRISITRMNKRQTSNLHTTNVVGLQPVTTQLLKLLDHNASVLGWLGRWYVGNCGTLFRSGCAIQTSPTDCSDDSWMDTFFRKHEHGDLWLLICWRHRKTLTYLLMLAAPLIQLSVNAGNGWPHNVLRYH